MIQDNKILTEVLERINYGIIVSNISGDFIFWNTKAQELVGLMDDVVKKDTWIKYFSVFTVEDTELQLEDYPIIKALSGVTTIGDRISVKNERLKHPVFLSVDSFPIRDYDFNIIGAAVIMADITEKIKMERLFEDLSVRFNHLRDLLEKSIAKN